MKRELPYNGKPLVMGIVNVTPDSFFDGGRYFGKDEAVEHALRLVAEGADIIDVGGESTRPFAEPLPAGEELERVVPVIEEIRRRSDVFISVDTYKAEVAEPAVLAGADMINDISGFTFDGDMAGMVARHGVYGVIMHIRGTPRDMQQDPSYVDVVAEIRQFLAERMEDAVCRGVARERIIVDPGIGFGKRIEDNLRIMKMLGEFKTFGVPVMIGTSMKSFIGRVTGAEAADRRDGTLASVAVAAWNGADIVRVHDAKGARRVVDFVDAVMRS